MYLKKNSFKTKKSSRFFLSRLKTQWWRIDSSVSKIRKKIKLKYQLNYRDLLVTYMSPIFLMSLFKSFSFFSIFLSSKYSA